MDLGNTAEHSGKKARSVVAERLGIVVPGAQVYAAEAVGGDLERGNQAGVYVEQRPLPVAVPGPARAPVRGILRARRPGHRRRPLNLPLPASFSHRTPRLARPGRGKRGGRVIYYWRQDKATIFMLVAYAKSVKTNLSPGEISTSSN